MSQLQTELIATRAHEAQEGVAVPSTEARRLEQLEHALNADREWRPRRRAVTEAKPVTHRSLSAGDARLEQLERAREKDRLWRAGRKAELKREINRGAILHILGTVVLMIGAYAAVRLSRPWMTRGGSHSPGTVAWELLSGLLPIGISLAAQWMFALWMGSRRDELALYELSPEDSAEPVVWSTGLVIHSAGNTESTKCNAPKS